MTLHFPDEVDTNVLTIDATDPKSGTAEFKAAAIRVEKIDAGEAAGESGRREPAAALASRLVGLARMDLHLLDAEPTEAERAAVDHLLGPPRLGWDGRLRGASRSTGDSRTGGHEARGRRAHAPARAACRAGARRLDQPRAR